MATDLQTDVTSNAQGPREARGDGVMVRQHSIPDQIAADRYLAAKELTTVSTKRTFGIRMGRLIPPGAAADD